MKNLITISLVLVSLASKAQQNYKPTFEDTVYYNAGMELVRYHKQATAGHVLMVFGGGLALIGASTKSSSTQAGFVGIGLASGIVGTLLSISSSRHVGNAGQLLLMLSGQPIEINKRRRRK